jgi:virginiamycin B lyase
MRQLELSLLIVSVAATMACTRFQTPVDAGSDAGMAGGGMGGADAGGPPGSEQDAPAEVGGSPPDVALTANGAACASDTVCGSGHCVDSRCCTVAACDACESCSGSAGTCTPIMRKEDPDTCSCAQICDGAGRCVDRITEFAVLSPQGQPYEIAAGPDGNIWFTLGAVNKIGRMAVDGSNLVELTVPTANARPSSVTAGPGDTIWFTEDDAKRIARANLSFTSVEEIDVPNSPGDITALPDGNIWFAESLDKIARISPDGTGLVEFAAVQPASIVWGPDGNVWVVEVQARKLARITPAGTDLVEFAVGGVVSVPARITSGPDGNIWFTDMGANAVGHVDRNGSQVMLFPLPTANGNPAGITSGPDGNLWVVETLGNKIDRVEPATGHPRSRRQHLVHGVHREQDRSPHSVRPRTPTQIALAQCPSAQQVIRRARPSVESPGGMPLAFTGQRKNLNPLKIG